MVHDDVVADHGHECGTLSAVYGSVWCPSSRGDTSSDRQPTPTSAAKGGTS
jgi:hypothetical protein